MKLRTTPVFYFSIPPCVSPIDISLIIIEYILPLNYHILWNNLVIPVYVFSMNNYHNWPNMLYIFTKINLTPFRSNHCGQGWSNTILNGGLVWLLGKIYDRVTYHLNIKNSTFGMPLNLCILIAQNYIRWVMSLQWPWLLDGTDERFPLWEDINKYRDANETD
jgi:hypothetical protein